MCESSELQLELLLDLVHIHALPSLDIYSLPLQLVDQFALGLPCADDSFLSLPKQSLIAQLQIRVLFKQSFNLLFEFVVVEYPLVLFPPLFLRVALDLSLFVPPSLLLFPILFLNVLSQVSLLFPLSFSFFPLIFPLVLQVFERLKVFLLEQCVVFM